MNKRAYFIRIAISWVIGILSIAAFIGVLYPLKIMDIQFLPLFQRVIFDFSITAVVIFTIISFITLFFGRFYCSTICPFGILQETIAFLRGKRKNSIQGNYKLKYLIAGLTFGCLIGGSAIIIRYIDPYSIFGSTATLSIIGLIFTSTIVILVLLKNRFFCTNICPVGTILGLISKFSPNKIYMDENCIKCGICANNCPSGCIDHKAKIINNETCVKCLKCLTVCPKGAVKYGIQPIKFNPKRRDFVWGIGALAILGAGYAAGLNFTKNIAKKVKDIILPAGADNPNRMANKCLNCNLCINNCPNGILSKSDDKFSVVHIDYNKGKGYCEYNCHKCSQVCPSGAIKKISLEEKQSTRIGMAAVNPHCIGCGACERECPTGAITVKKPDMQTVHTDILYKAVIDGSKCIGCGKCAVACKPNAINIFAVNEQSRV